MRKLIALGGILALLGSPLFALTEEELELEKQKIELERQKLELEKEKMKMEQEKKSNSGSTNNIYVNTPAPAAAPAYQAPVRQKNDTRTSMYISINSFGGGGTREYNQDDVTWASGEYTIGGSYMAIGFGAPDETRFEIASGTRTLEDADGNLLDATSLDLNWIFTGGAYRSSNPTNGMGYFKFGFGVISYDYGNQPTDFDNAFALRFGLGYIINMNESFELSLGYDLEIATASATYEDGYGNETTESITDTSGMIVIGAALRF